MIPATTSPEPNDSIFTQACQRLGVAPLRYLFIQVARAKATRKTKGVFY